MITSPAFAGKRYAVLGLARSGLATVEALVASGAHVTAWDRQDNARAKVDAANVLLADPLEIDLTGYDGVVVSPGVPLNTHPIAKRAAQFGVPVIGDIELFALARPSLPPHKVVGITGTNGKSTTTALVHHILQTAGVPTTMGGNIGLPILAQDPLPEGGVYVLELSSYQIDLTFSLDCDVAVLLNITPDHLDRYESFEAYAASKLRLVDMQTASHWWVHTDDPLLLQYDYDADELPRQNAGERSVHASTEYPNCLGSVVDGVAKSDSSRVGFQKNWPSLQGPHNAQNAAASIAVCRLMELKLNEISLGLRTFTGLPHRMERFATHNGVTFVNDSKATNPDSSAPALAAFPPENGTPRIHWIVGGLPKEDGLGATEQHLANVKAAYTIGEAGPRFAELLEGRVPVTRSEMLCEATRQAIAAADPGDVVLLSPACASFDQFKDYEQRGERFRQFVEALTEDPAADPCAVQGHGEKAA
ncbi:UDP-N-acetylmuramoyl-L-alanine--D-glutamate ligase [Altererythrobacter sp. TH136]|uniref:UDP-N-acetylmuramoyl-L-alanine--D-glutamate ligase n=1 Tax=Altererythrobacter sp. TH136 TaxID=2067415 RepID=UPI0011646A10|nr:UDP-N-acetylmuramoyl-L-alanine--D-glutamate ligase [Altererythrobacter sp. TH136]QDM41636.1 UDP-N-acetylmuramoyl-L-alanine--D-glutamate ligase [Altererythrobacter sp. TH136]